MTDEEIKTIYEEEYVKKHIGAYTLGKKYNYNFYRDFNRLGLKIRNNQEKNRKFYCDSDYFKIIDTEEKAYWLGFIFADGYITHSSGNPDVKRFGISITEGDSNHLEKFKKAINSNVPIRHYIVTQGYKVGSGYCRIILSDDRFARNLISHGCVEQKSNILNPPTGLPKELEKHFIRGFMDGNGSITQNNSRYGLTYTIKWASTESVLLWIMNHLIENGILKHTYKLSKRKEEHIVSSFEFGGNYLSKKFLDYIYDDATVWLDRKYERYIKLNETIKEKENNKMPHKCEICGDENSYRYLRYNNIVVCSKHYSQLRKYGKIIPDKKLKCEICGDDYGKLIHVGSKFTDYFGMTLCRKHYQQIIDYGEFKDNIKGIHINE